VAFIRSLVLVWGNIDPPRTILIGNDHLVVTPNLYAALKQLRDADFPRVIWIDAICINQADTHEKEIQTQSMAKTYGLAGRVVVWLGESADSSDEALTAIRTAGIVSTNSHDNTKTSWAIFSLLQRQWFQRVWVRLPKLWLHPASY
jgi:arginase family enzyme